MDPFGDKLDKESCVSPMVISCASCPTNKVQEAPMEKGESMVPRKKFTHTGNQGNNLDSTNDSLDPSLQTYRGTCSSSSV